MLPRLHRFLNFVLRSFAGYLFDELFGVKDDLATRLCKFSVARSWPGLTGLVGSSRGRASSASV